MKFVWDTTAIINIKEPDETGYSPAHSLLKDLQEKLGVWRGLKVTILRDINLAIGRKEVVGVIGESGCGKSTLARVISGLLPPVSGDVLLDGEKLTFSIKDDRFVDDQTGSFWNILGEAVEGEMEGQSLTPIVHGNHFWFAWGAFNDWTPISTARN